MKLLPAMIFIVIIFLAGFFFLRGRSAFRRRGFRGAPYGQTRTAGLAAATVALLGLFSILFMFFGKIALLIALSAFAIFLLSNKTRRS